MAIGTSNLTNMMESILKTSDNLDERLHNIAFDHGVDIKLENS